MILKRRYRFENQLERFTVPEAIEVECRSLGDGGVVEQTESRVNSLIELFGFTVQTLVRRGVISKDDVEEILNSFEVVE